MNDEDRSVADLRAELAHWGSEAELNPLDSLMWRTERHPSASWSGVVLQILGFTPDWDRLRAAHLWAFRLVPRFTERVVDPILPTGPPRWTTDPAFDLDNHLQRVVLPSPGSMSQLLQVAEEQAVRHIDRHRSPWVALFVEGLEGGRSAYIFHAHHVLMDGAGATQLFSRILDRAEKHVPSPPPPSTARPSTTSVTAALRGIGWQARAARSMVGRAVGAALATASNPAASVKGTAAYLASLKRVTAPPPAPESDLLKPGPRTRWRFGVLECELSDLKTAGKKAGGTVNDIFVCAILGGLRAYHARHGATLGDVPISMPVSVRRDDDPMGGNRFTGAFFAAPSGVEDPVERVHVMRQRVSAVREEPALDFLNALTPAMNLAPSPLVTAAITAMTTNATLTTSSWPGVSFPTYVSGAEFQRMFVFGPLPGTSMCAALVTHVGTCCIGINVDGDVFPDTDVLWQCMQEGLDEVLAIT